MKKKCGFTLIEMIMVILLIGILFAVSAPILLNGFNAYFTSINSLNAIAQGQIALARMARDIQAMRSPSDFTTNGTTTLAFTDINGTADTYTLTGTTLTLNGNILANGVNSLAFTYYGETGTAGPALASIRYVQIALNVTLNNVNLNLTTSIYPRNLVP